eukprot:g16006.t1
MAVLVGAVPAPGDDSVTVQARTSATVRPKTPGSDVGLADGDSGGPNTVPPTPNHRQESPSSHLKHSWPPDSHDGDGVGPSQPSPTLPSALPPPLPPPPRPAQNLVSPGPGVEVLGSTRAEGQRCDDRVIRDPAGKDERAKDDMDNHRRLLVGGVLTLLEQIFVDEGGHTLGTGRGRHGRVVRDLGDQHDEQASVEQERCRSRVWDIVIAVLSDSWSEIRKIGAARARSLAATFGPSEAWVLYITAAARCRELLVLPDSWSNQPRQWKRMHGMLLGMRAAVEGAAAAVSTRVPPASTSSVTSRVTASSPLGEWRPAAPRDNSPVGDGGTPGSFPGEAAEETTQAGALAQFAADVRVASTPPAAATGVGVAFRCLCHRQAVVREAAIGLVHSLAYTLGPPAALALYLGIIRALQHEQENGRANVQKDSTTGARRYVAAPDNPRPPLTTPVPIDNTSDQPIVDQGEARAELPSDSGRRGERRVGERVGLERIGAAGTFRAASCSSRAETKRKCDRISGLLGLLERIVGSHGLLPSGTVGSSWERLFPILRCYTGHPETSLRQAASAVFLRVATDSKSPAGGVVVPALSSSHGDSTLEEEEVGLGPSQRRAAACFGHDASARVVLWALVRGLSQPHQQQLGCRAKQVSARAEAGAVYGDGGKGSTTRPPWQFREGVLLVYEGILKHLVESRTAETVCGGAVGEPCSETFHDDAQDVDNVDDHQEWPAHLLRETPPLGELLVPLLSQAEHALHEAEVMRSTASHPQQQLQEPNDGSLELWRAGSQLLPAIARAMVWWNPTAILRACERAAGIESKISSDTEEKEEVIVSSKVGGQAATSRRVLLPSPSVGPQEDRSNLLRITRISIAAELLRASVRHARHLAESLVDGRPVSASGGAGAGAEDVDNGAGGHFGGQAHCRTAGVVVEIANGERWGGSTDGITDTSGGGDGVQTNSPPPGTASVHAERGASSTVVASSASADRVAESSSVSAAERGARAQGTCVSPPAVARLVGETLDLARDAPSLLARAVGALSAGNGGAILPDRDREKAREQGGPARECTAGTPSPRERQASSPSCAAAAAAVAEGVAEQPKHRWVFTGVIDALVMAESLVATTTLSLHHATKPEKPQRAADCSGDRGDSTRREQQFSAPSASPSLPAETPGGEQSSPSTGSTDKIQNVDEAGSLTAARSDHHLSLIERQLELLHERALSTGAGTDGRRSASSTTATLFVVPFSWGSLSLLRRAPTLFEEERKAGDPGVRWISVSPSEAHAHLLSAIGIALQNIAASPKSAVADGNNSIERRRRQHGPRYLRRQQRHQQEEGVEEEGEGKPDEVVAAVRAVVGALTRGLTSSGKHGWVGPSLFPQMCSLATHVVDLLLRLVLLAQERRDRSVHALVRLDVYSQPPTRLAASTRRRAWPSINASDSFTLVGSLLRSVAEHLVRWYPPEQVENLTEPAEKNDFQNSVQEDDAAGEPVQSGGDVGDDRDDWDDWDDDDDEGANEQQRSSSSASSGFEDGGRNSRGAARTESEESARIGAAFRGAAVFVRSAAAFFESSAAAAAAAVETSDGRSLSRGTVAKKVALTKPASDEEKQQDEGDRHPTKAVLPPILSGADAFPGDVGYEAEEEERAECPKPTRDTRTIDSGGSPSDLHRLPPSFVAVLGGLLPAQRQALLRAWAFDAAVSSPQCAEEQPAVTVGKPASVRGG